MATLPDYHHFFGRHWETGSACNALAYQGVRAPHTGQPISEALLMGISGGAVMGYFSFSYRGFDPHVVILTRNTFDPWDRMLARLGVVQEVRQTTSAAKAEAYLVRVIEEGSAPLVWADVCSMPYNANCQMDGYWHMYPLVVFGYEPEQGVVRIADRSRAPLSVTPEELALARRRVKKSDHRIITLDLPNFDRLTGAVQQGLYDCIRLYTEAPPKGSRDNFGLAAFKRWADVLTRPRARLSWASEFPPGLRLYAGLTSAYQSIMIDGKDGGAERRLFASFLDEASTLLARPRLREVAVQFRAAAEQWDTLASALLPDSVPLLGDTRRLLWDRHQRFLAAGHDAAFNLGVAGHLAAIRTQVSEAFPLGPAETDALLGGVAALVADIGAREEKAVAELQRVLHEPGLR